MLAGIPGGALADFGFAVLSIVVLAGAIVAGAGGVRGYQRSKTGETLDNYKESSASWKEACASLDRQLTDLRTEMALVTAKNAALETQNATLQRQLDELRDLVQGVEQLKELRKELGVLGRQLVAGHKELLDAIRGGSHD